MFLIFYSLSTSSQNLLGIRGQFCDSEYTNSLILVLIIIGGGSALVSLLHVLATDAARLATSERRAHGEVNVLLRVQTDHERGDVHDLLADTI